MGLGFAITPEVVAVAIFITGGAVFIIGGSIGLFRIITTRRGGVRTWASVIGNHAATYSAGPGGLGGPVPTVRQVATYSQVIRFNTQDGRIVEIKAHVSSSFVEVGKQVPIVYQPSKPERAILYTGMGTWLGPILALVIGVVAIFLAGLIGLGLVPVGE